MELQTSLIDLDSIETIASNEFSIDPEKQATAIEHLAHSIVKLGGLIRIPVVEQVKIDVYKLIAGHFDYYAYLKARELDPDLPDRLRVFIVNPKKAITQEILTQLKAIERIQGATMSKNNTAAQTSEVDMQLRNLQDLCESRFSQLSQELKVLNLLTNISAQVSGVNQVIGALEQKLDQLPNSQSNRAGDLPSYEALQSLGLTHHQILKTQITVLRNKGHKTPALTKKVSELEAYIEKFKETHPPIEKPKEQEQISIAEVAIVENPIVSYDAFVEESMKVLKKLNSDYNYDNLVPIYHLRRELGDRVDRTQFNEWLLEMHAKSFFELMTGSMPDIMPDIVDDSVRNKFGSIYYSISLD
jgi:hypothetical protein